MNAIEVKRIIDKKLDQVAETIAFSYGEKYSEKILDQVSELNYYIYDNDYYQIDRLVDIELFKVASEFAKDISDDLDVSEKRRKEINEHVAVAIQFASSLSNPDEYLKKKLSLIKELEKDIDAYVEKAKKLMGFYLKDHEVKKINQIIQEASNQKNSFDVKTINFKRAILQKRFHIKANLDNEMIVHLWDLLESFNPAMETYMSNSYEYCEAVYAQQEEFYRLLGCKGITRDELSTSALIKGIYVNDDVFYSCKNEYMIEFDKLVEDYYFTSSNLDDIFDDLDRKGFYYDKKSISTFIIEVKNLCGVNFVCNDELGNEINFIVCNNNSRLYSREFNETFIHEIVHYIGGVNPNICKKGLCYNGDMRYLNLEEAYTNYFAKEIAAKYTSEYGDLVESNNFDKISTPYDCTLLYMKEVFKLYEEELKEIQMSNTISERMANRMCPFSQIADSVTRIKEAKSYELDCVIKEEIAKLNRRR